MSEKLLIEDEFETQEKPEENANTEDSNLSEKYLNFKITENTKNNIKKAGLLILVTTYTSIGALIFQALEYEVDVSERKITREYVRKDRRIFLNVVTEYCLLNNSFIEQLNWTNSKEELQDEENELDFQSILVTALENYEWSIKNGISSGLSPDEIYSSSLLQNRWSYTQSLFFAATVLTTIGYGNIAPSTHWGRIFCIGFALIGIPLTLSVIADMGEILASLVPVDKLKKILPKGRLRTILTIFGTFSLLLSFIALGGGLFCWFEGWTFLDAFYFCFITTTTIGFGDLVPKSSSLLVCGLYILIGLALTSTVIEIARRQYAIYWDKMKLLTMRLHQLSTPLAEAMKRMAETGSGEVEVDTELVRELQQLNSVLAEVQDDARQESDPWQLILDIAKHKKKISVIMYESSV